MIEKKKELNKRIKELEDELSDCKAQLTSFINNFPFVSWIKNTEGKYLLANDPFFRILDKTPEQVIGKYDEEVLPAGKLEDIRKQDKLIEETGKKMLFTDKVGDNWYEIYKTPIKDRNGKTTGIAGMQRDVSEIRKAMENLNTEKDLLRSLMDNFPYPIYFKDTESRFIRINKAQARMLGITDPDEAIGKTDFDFFTPQHAQEAFNDEQRILITGEQLIDKTERVRTGEGNFIWVSTTKVPIKNQNGEITGLVGISIDVTEKYLAEQKIHEARKKAIESDKLKSAFLANMSHEIRTPMNGIIGFSNLLKNEKIDKDQQNEYLGYIEKCGNSLLHLIDDIIDVSKIEAGQLVIRESETCISEILHELFISFDKNRISENKKEIELRLLMPANLGKLYTNTDPNRLKQVLSNLIANAFKFTEKGYIEFGYRILDGNVEFYVKDTGVGIPKDKFNYIFERFGQVTENERLNHNGTGLGLAISVNIVKLLGGRMWLESETGKGSTFYFSIPLKNEYFPDLKKVQQFPVVKKRDWIGKKLLIVDDEELNWLFIRDLIEPTQAQLIWAKNGQEALEIFQYDTKIDLILMDFRMPVMNGYEATMAIRSFDPVIPIIALTAFAQDEERELIVHAGCNAFLSKPVHNEQLFNTVNYFLEN
jgi:PAS domain S-box-containing protein